MHSYTITTISDGESTTCTVVAGEISSVEALLRRRQGVRKRVPTARVVDGTLPEAIADTAIVVIAGDRGAWLYESGAVHAVGPALRGVRDAQSLAVALADVSRDLRAAHARLSTLARLIRHARRRALYTTETHIAIAAPLAAAHEALSRLVLRGTVTRIIRGQPRVGPLCLTRGDDGEWRDRYGEAYRLVAVGKNGSRGEVH